MLCGRPKLTAYRAPRSFHDQVFLQASSQRFFQPYREKLRSKLDEEVYPARVVLGGSKDALVEAFALEVGRNHRLQQCALSESFDNRLPVIEKIGSALQRARCLRSASGDVFAADPSRSDDKPGLELLAETLDRASGLVARGEQEKAETRCEGC